MSALTEMLTWFLVLVLKTMKTANRQRGDEMGLRRDKDNQDNEGICSFSNMSTSWKKKKQEKTLLNCQGEKQILDEVTSRPFGVLTAVRTSVEDATSTLRFYRDLGYFDWLPFVKSDSQRRKMEGRLVKKGLKDSLLMEEIALDTEDKVAEMAAKRTIR